MNAKGENASGFTSVDQTHDPGFFIEFLELRKMVEGELD
jgi:hypothetical protein